jgi:hypothetical protein
MHARICSILTILLLFSANSHADTSCADPAELAHVGVSILRNFDDAERSAKPDVIGIRGAAWFLSPTIIVTAGHVADAMRLSTQDWKPMEIADGDHKESMPARIQRLVGAQPEKLAVIELQAAVSGARSVEIRRAPLVPDEKVVTFANRDGRPRLVNGRFVQFGDGKLAGTALLEMFDGDDRLAVDHGASGAPVLDCEGRVAAIVSLVFTQTVYGPSRAIRISTAWGMPNVVSVPVTALEASAKAE